ncbi:hypothetical protein IGI04_002064 [Brassica rapa subsp. trilocularis]|uniref:Transcription factor domain-containing protein n=1 Tax=Brassica rapa subsp. trilocularis TaxID=1813537 RepID=A0ABQ7NUH0_BRACM|nr:hypothetical protein IGI04_002064 [Brassica rapa subsp. trilocularis]
MGLESCFRSLWAVFRLDTFTTSFPRLREIAFEGLTRMHGLVSYRCSERFNRYTATELWLEPGRYVATELWLELGHYVATERDDRSVAT